MKIQILRKRTNQIGLWAIREYTADVEGVGVVGPILQQGDLALFVFPNRDQYPATFLAEFDNSMVKALRDHHKQQRADGCSDAEFEAWMHEWGADKRSPVQDRLKRLARERLDADLIDSDSSGVPKQEGQLWERCERCGCEPVYMPLMLCDDCWPKETKKRGGK